MYKLLGKRILDIIGSIFLIITLAPVFLILGVLIRVKLGAPILFSQIRPGLNATSFKMYKFRSMTNETNQRGMLLSNEERLTKFGKKLRNYSLDELPELWNVLKGEMSFVGPRPLRIQYLEHYSKFQKKRHSVKPGITGWAQINGRNQTSWSKRFELDVWYTENISFFLDLKVLFLTLYKVVKKEGVSPEKSEFLMPFTGQRD